MTDPITDCFRHHSVLSGNGLPQNSSGAITEADILITAALADRPARQPNLAAENKALHTLAQKLMDEPQALLKTLVRIAKDLCQADTAGVSLLETLRDGTSVFRWMAIAGALESLEQTTAPSHFSPCGTTIRYGEPQLYARPERYFTYLHHPQFPVVEGLLLPLYVNDQPLGTIWLLSHTQQRRFDREDQRLITSLAGFTAAALQSIHLRQAAENALRREQDIRTKQEQAETSLRQSEEFNRQILDSSDDCIKILNLSGRLLYMNHRGQTLLGVQDMAPLLNDAWTEFWQGADRQAAFNAIDIAKAGGVGSFQGYCPTLLGESKWWDVKLTPIWGAEGQAERLLCISRDITEQKRVEDERKRAKLNADLLATVSQDLVGAISVSEIVQTVGDYLNRYLNTSMCAFVEINEKANQAVINYDWHQDDVPSLIGVYSLPEFVSPDFLQVIKDGQTIVVRDVAADSYIVDRQRFDTLKIGSFINVPSIRNNEWKFTLGVYHQAPYNWQADEIELMCELAARIWDRIERARAEEALRESEERLRCALAIETVGVIFFRTDGCITDANDAFLRMTGYSRKEMEQGLVRWDLLTPPDWIPHSLKVIEEVISTGHTTPYEKEYIRKDGSRWWALVAASRLNAAEGVEFVVDITARKRAERALRQSESRLRLMIESAKDYAIFTLDLNGTIASWNSGAERVLGYTEIEAIGRNSCMIFTPEDKQRGQPEWEKQTALTQGRAENERWHVRKDGSRFWASGLMMSLQDEVGNVQGFVKILQDKTSQRQANERFHLLYDTTSDLLATEHPLALMHNLFSKLSIHMELHCYYNFLVEEKDSRPMLHLRNYQGLSEETAKAIEWIEFGEYLCGQVAQQQRQIVLDQAQIAAYPNVQFISSMGITAYAGQPLIVQGRLLGILAFASRTRTHFMPEEIDLLQSTCDQIAIAIDRSNLIASIQQQAEQLQQANRIKDEFLAVLSHELRSPLSPILGWSKLLQTGKLDEARSKQALATIERNAKLQAELIEDLLDVSRILQGKLSLTVSSVNLASTIEAAIDTVRLAAEAKSIQIETRLDPEVGQVAGDATRLQQVAWNLLSNAVKFTPAGGRVEVRLEQVDHHAQITVSDTGKGISPDFLPHVFDYFRQADSATTRKFGGLGLGLAIVRHLVELHGGTIQANSTGEDLGSSFTVKLPLMPTQLTVGQALQLSKQSLNLQDIRILVVDDDTDTRDFIAFLLEQAGASVITAASANEALIALTQSQPAFLISDIGMPDMDGYTLIRRVRALPPEQGGNIPAIALTAYAGEMNQQQATLAGFQLHLAKPVDPEELIRAITSLRATHISLKT